MFAYLFFFDDTPTTEIYTLSLPTLFRSSAAIVASAFRSGNRRQSTAMGGTTERTMDCRLPPQDRKSTRLNSSHRCISYAVFCLKKKNKSTTTRTVVYTIHRLRAT